MADLKRKGLIVMAIRVDSYLVYRCAVLMLTPLPSPIQRYWHSSSGSC